MGGDIGILTADSHCCIAKPTQHCKAIILQSKKEEIKANKQTKTALKDVL